MVAYLRGLNPHLPRAVLILQAGLVFNAFGNGAVNPFTVIYLHDVRGIPFGVAGLAAATAAFAAVCGALAGGSLADRFGPRATLIAGLVLAAGAWSAYPLIRTGWHALVLAAAAGYGGGTWLTSQSSLLAVITPPDRRHAAFAQQRVAANIGLGLGGFAAGLIVSTSQPSTFTILYLGNALTFLVYAGFVLRLPVVKRARATAAGGYRAVLRDGTFLRLLVVNLVFVAAAIALLNSLAPVFAKNEAGVTERGIGLLFLVNTLFIVLAQLPIAKAQEGRRRMRAFGLMGCFFAASWLLVLVAGVWLAAAAATAVLALAFVVFGVAECLYDAVQGPLIADLAPESLTGRYMAAAGFSWQLGFIVGPGLGGFMLGAEPFALWPLAAGLCLGGAAYALRLERRIPESYRRTPTRAVPAPPAPVEAPA